MKFLLWLVFLLLYSTLEKVAGNSDVIKGSRVVSGSPGCIGLFMYLIFLDKEAEEFLCEPVF